MVVKNEFEPVFPANLFLEILDFRALKLDESSAPDADHMIVMPAGAYPFEKFALAFAYGFLDHTTLQQKRNRPVNGVARNPEPFVLKALVEAVGVKMAFQVADFVKNNLTLVGKFQAFFIQQGLEFKLFIF